MSRYKIKGGDGKTTLGEVLECKEGIGNSFDLVVKNNTGEIDYFIVTCGDTKGQWQVYDAAVDNSPEMSEGIAVNVRDQMGAILTAFNLENTANPPTNPEAASHHSSNPNTLFATQQQTQQPSDFTLTVTSKRSNNNVQVTITSVDVETRTFEFNVPSSGTNDPPYHGSGRIESNNAVANYERGGNTHRLTEGHLSAAEVADAVKEKCGDICAHFNRQASAPTKHQ